jgi:8-oxo-dGTP diphosphatase
MNQYQKVAAHGLIKNKNGKFLVTKRSKTDDYQPGVWDIPGGTIEFGEEPEKALLREVLEETDLTVKVFKPIYVFAYLSGPERHQFQIVYDCEYIDGEVKLNSNDHDKYRWVSKEELKSIKKIAFLKGLSENILS